MVDRLKVPALPLFVIATAFGVSSTIQAYSIRVLEDGNTSVRSLLPLLGLNLVYWYVPALLAPTIMAVALRYRLGRVRWSTQVAVHLAGVLVYSLRAHLRCCSRRGGCCSRKTGRPRIPRSGTTRG